MLGDGDNEDEWDEDEGEGSQELVDFSPGSFIVAPYGEQWYLGQILDKNKEVEADKSDHYVYVNYMDRVGVNTFKWPVKRDLLDTLKSDVFFSCDPPTISTGTSSSRTMFAMDKDLLPKAALFFSKVPLTSFSNTFQN